jgi:hypothetical protein
MTWSAELWHLLKKDAAEHRWLAVLYLVIVVMAMGHAMSWHPLESSMLSMMMVLVAIAGGALTATAIQGDSPTQPDAFWSSHPIDASAVFATKLCSLVLIVAIATLAQVLVLRWFDLTWSESLHLVGQPAFSFAFGLLGALVVGAITRDVRTFVLAIVAIPITLIILGVLLDNISPKASSLRFTSSGLLATKVACVVAELLLLAWLYRSRDNRWLTRIFGFALVVLTLFTLLASLSPPARSDATVPEYVPRIAVRVVPRDARMPQTPADLGFDLIMPPDPEGYRYAIDGAKALVRLRDGSKMQIDLAYGLLQVSSSSFPLRPSVPLLPGVKWLGTGRRPDRRINLTGMVGADQRARLTGGVDSIAIDAKIRVLALAATDTIALSAGSERRDAGRFVRVEEWDPRNGNFLLTVRMENVTGKSPMEITDWIGEAGSRYALLNQRRGEGVALPESGNGFEVSGIVLPGSVTISNTARYGSREPAGAAAMLDPGWLRDARLLVITPVPLGSYRVHLEAPPPSVSGND